MSSRLKILDNYLTRFPLPYNKSFSQGEMVEIVLSMLPTVWVSIMTTAGLNPRGKFYEDLIGHLEKLEVSLPDEEIPKKHKRKDASPDTSFFKKDKKDSKKINFGKEAKDHHQKSCEICKTLKGSDNPTWNTHTTSEYRSKD